MNREHIKKYAAAFLLAVLAVFAVAPIRFAKTDAKNWMAKLDDERRLNTLSIPGTHDSGAIYSIADVYGKCQSLPVSEQLSAGVRYLDIRLRLVDDGLFVYHGFAEQKTEFSRLLYEIASFLRENTSEFLLVSLKEEAEPVRSQTAFPEMLEKQLSEYPDVVSRARTLPENVGAARGKMHILARYKNASVGVDCAHGWQNDTTFVLHDLYVQDNYEVDSSDDKLSDIETALKTAQKEQFALTLNYTSCYYSSGFPPAYAGAPAHTINPWLADALADTDGAAGVIVCDFMTSNLANAVIGRNFQ